MSAVLRYAHRFDEVSNGLLDKNMCTNTCPCYSVEPRGNNSSPEEMYRNIPEIKMNTRGRTRYRESKEGQDLTPLNFLRDKNVAFNNFEECYFNWLTKKEIDDSIDLIKLF